MAARTAFPADVLVFDDRTGHYPLGPFLEILEDPKGEWEIGDVSAGEPSGRFRASPSPVPNLGLTSSIYWLRFRVRNETSRERTWLLEMEWPIVDRVEIFLPKASGEFERKRAGELIPFREWEVAYRSPVFEIPLQPGEAQTLFVRVEGDDTMILPFDLWSPEAFADDQIVETAVYAFYYGVLVLLVVYNLLLFASLRDRNHLYYVLLIGSIILYHATKHGFAKQYLWPESIEWARWSIHVSAILAFLFAALFSRAFLATRAHLPGMDRVLRLFAPTAGAMLLWPLFGTVPGFIRVAGLLAVVGCFLFVASGFVCWRRGYRPALYYLLMWSVSSAGIAVYALWGFGYLPNSLLTDYVLEVAILPSAITLSLGLADRINVLRADLETSVEEKERLLQSVGELNRTLEERIRERTAELQERTRDLQRLLEEARAMSEIERAIGASLDLGRILDSIVRTAVSLSGADACAVFEIDRSSGDTRYIAAHNMSREFLEALERVSRVPPEAIPDVLAAVGQAEGVAALHRFPTSDAILAGGFRSYLWVPMPLAATAHGIVLFRKTPGPFDDRTVELLTTLADHSKVAIENARLFRELDEKSRELEAVSRHKSEFLANMSHELRTPLNAVIGFSEVLAERMFGELNEKQAEHVEDILDSGRHLLSLINDILDLAKIEAGRLELELSTFDLPAVIANAMILIRERASRRGMRLSTDIGPGVGEMTADERKVKQILINLLSNAVKFTPEGGAVTVGASQADGAVEIWVADTGVGIAPQDQEIIFEEFRQVGGGYAHKQQGTGLGLTLSRKFVELHGGRIRVESEPGRGSRFSFTLPLRDSVDDQWERGASA